jgi:hypothetical protein
MGEQVSVFDSGRCEPLKLSVHAALGSLALLCLGYNSLAFLRRRERHLAMNVLLYGSLLALETRKVRHHREAV